MALSVLLDFSNQKVQYASFSVALDLLIPALLIQLADPLAQLDLVALEKGENRLLNFYDLHRRGNHPGEGENRLLNFYDACSN